MFRHVFVVLAASSSVAMAQPATSPPAAQPGQVQPQAPQVPASSFSAEPVALMVAAFDADGDGRVTRAEFDAGVARTFAATGETMSLIEFSNWSVRWLGHQGALPGQFDFDRDGDDRISRAEYAAQFGRTFARFDLNKDEVLDRSELVIIKVQPQPMPGKGKRRGR